MAKLLNRLGFVYKMPKKVPAKADEVVQRKLVEEVSDLMQAANDDTPLYFVDGTHPWYTAQRRTGPIARARPGN